MFAEFLKKYSQVLGIGCGCLTLAIVIIVAGAVCVAGMSVSEDPAPTSNLQSADDIATNRETVAVDVRKILDDYESNALRADDMYNGRNIHVTGYVESVDDGMFGEKIVTLSDGSAFSFEWVTATLLDSAVPAAKALSKGDTATLICGEVTGDLLGVSLAHCSVK